MAFRKMGRDFPSKIGIKMDVQLGSMGKTFQKKKKDLRSKLMVIQWDLTIFNCAKKGRMEVDVASGKFNTLLRKRLPI